MHRTSTAFSTLRPLAPRYGPLLYPLPLLLLPFQTQRFSMLFLADCHGGGAEAAAGVPYLARHTRARGLLVILPVRGGESLEN